MSPGRRAVGWTCALLVLAGLVVLLRTTVAVPVRVDSSSMRPTFRAGDVVLVSRRAPAVTDLARGQLVVFRSPEDGQRALKRVVGLPGDVLVVRDGRLYVNDVRVREPQVNHALIDGYYSRTFRVPKDRVFVMGDNRGNSVDSRNYGPVRAADLLGRVLVKVWPARF